MSKESFGLVKDPFVEPPEEGGESGYDEMLPGGICHYDGPGSALPIGGYSVLPGWVPEMAAKRWLVAAPEEDSGFLEKKTSELLPTDHIIGVELNTALLKRLIATYGEGFYLIREANGGPLMTITQWNEAFGTDGLGLVAIRNMRRKLGKGGITVMK